MKLIGILFGIHLSILVKAVHDYDRDILRAKQVIPRNEYRGDNREKMAVILNQHLLADPNLNTKPCESFEITELNELGTKLFSHLDPRLNQIYNDSRDGRQLRHSSLDGISNAWDAELQLIQSDAAFHDYYRNKKCREMVMWYTHHLTEDTRDEMKSDITLPLMPVHNNDRRQLQGFGFMAYDYIINGTENIQSPFDSCWKCHTNGNGSFPLYAKPPNMSDILPPYGGYSTEEFSTESFSWTSTLGMAIVPEFDSIYVIQRAAPPILIFTMDGELNGGFGDDDLGSPHSITYHDESLWITDMNTPRISGVTGYGHCVKQFDLNGTYIDSIGICGNDTAGTGLNPVQFDKPTDIAFGSDGLIYISDGDIGSLNNRVLQLLYDPLDATYEVIQAWNSSNGAAGDGPGEFDLPHQLVVDECQRVWIADLKNNRIQIIDSDGNFLGEWTCLPDNSYWGIDFIQREVHNIGYSLAVSTGPNRKISLLGPINMDCDDLSTVGDCNIQEEWTVNGPSHGALLHELDVDPDTSDIYVSTENTTTQPLKYDYLNLITVTPSPTSVTATLPESFSVKIVLHPFLASDSEPVTAIFSYDSTAQTMMFIRDEGAQCIYLDGAAGTITRKGDTCTTTSTNNTVPARNFLQGRGCVDVGEITLFDREVRAWSCGEKYLNFRDWFWMDIETKLPLRIMFGSPNAVNIWPIFQEYSMVIFELDDIDVSTDGYSCSCDTDYSIDTDIEGFTIGECIDRELFEWPQQFLLSAMMYPVNRDEMFPTQVIYKWVDSFPQQRTRMFNTSSVDTSWVDAVLVSGTTYQIVRWEDGAFECLDGADYATIPLGPPRMQWTDDCKCRAVYNNTPVISPDATTIVMTCPIGDYGPSLRQFWIYWTTENGYTPILFMETAAPYGEGTNLAFADYGEGPILNPIIAGHTFDVPFKCSTPAPTTTTPTSAPTEEEVDIAVNIYYNPFWSLCILVVIHFVVNQ